MIKKIKNNPLYNFIFRIVIVFIFSSIVWVFLVNSYYEEQISAQIKQEMEQPKQKILELLKLDISKLKEEILKIDKERMVEYLAFYNEKNQRIFLYEKDKGLEDIKFLIEKLGALHFEPSSELIPVSKEDGYLYHQAFLKVENEKIHFKILIKLDNSTLNMIREGIKETLFIVIITTLLLFFSILPLIYKQYKSMIQKQKELQQSNINTLIALGNAVAKRDSDTNEHNYRVTYYSIKLAEALNLEKKQIQSLIKGSFLHDIGKIAISDNILLKPAKLTDEEFELMKTHVLHGVDIIKEVTWLKDARNVILYHHEKVDGTGYPQNKKADEIPIEAKIFSIVDVFDALTSKRPYKEPLDSKKSFEIIKKDVNTHFDEEITIKFESIYKELHLSLKGKSKEELSEIFYESLKPYFYN